MVCANYGYHPGPFIQPCDARLTGVCTRGRANEKFPVFRGTLAAVKFPGTVPLSRIRTARILTAVKILGRVDRRHITMHTFVTVDLPGDGRRDEPVSPREWWQIAAKRGKGQSSIPVPVNHGAPMKVHQIERDIGERSHRSLTF